MYRICSSSNYGEKGSEGFGSGSPKRLQKSPRQIGNLRLCGAGMAVREQKFGKVKMCRIYQDNK